MKNTTRLWVKQLHDTTAPFLTPFGIILNKTEFKIWNGSWNYKVIMKVIKDHVRSDAFDSLLLYKFEPEFQFYKA